MNRLIELWYPPKPRLMPATIVVCADPEERRIWLRRATHLRYNRANKAKRAAYRQANREAIDRKVSAIRARNPEKTRSQWRNYTARRMVLHYDEVTRYHRDWNRKYRGKGA